MTVDFSEEKIQEQEEFLNILKVEIKLKNND